MAVIDAFNTQDLRRVLFDHYDLRLVRAEPTALGIENTNYFIEAQDQRGQHLALVVTLLSDPAHSEFSAEWVQHLHRAGLPVPRLIKGNQRQAIVRSDNRGFWLAERASGAHTVRPQRHHRQAIAQFLHGMHDLAEDFVGIAPGHPRDHQWLRHTLTRSAPRLGKSQRQTLNRAVDHLAALEVELAQLPKAIVHGDLFRDNALFEGARLSAVIDFHHCAQHARLFDLGVVAIDWCLNRRQQMDQRLLHELIQDYGELSDAEHRHVGDFVLWAAAAFALARLSPANERAPTKDAQPLIDLIAERLSSLKD